MGTILGQIINRVLNGRVRERNVRERPSGDLRACARIQRLLRSGTLHLEFGLSELLVSFD